MERQTVFLTGSPRTISTAGGNRMIRHHIWKQGPAAVMAVTLAFAGIMGMTGCSVENTENGGGDPERSSGSANASSEENSENAAMGRYLEEDVSVPENCEQLLTMRFLEDGALRVCYTDENYMFYYADSRDGGASWSEGISLLAQTGLDGDVFSVSYPQLSGDGGIFLTVTNSEEQDLESGEYGLHLYYIDPEGKAGELPGSSELVGDGYVTEAKFTDQGTIILNLTGRGLAEVNLADGSVKAEYEKGTFVNYFTVDRNRLITVTDTLHYYDLETGEPVEDAEALTEKITADESNLQLSSTTSFPVVFAEGDEEDSLFFAERDGLYRYSFGGSIVEQVIDGSLNSIGSPDTALVSLARDEEGNFYLASMDSTTGKGRLLKYVYSPDTPAVPETELTVYSLRENSYMSQIAALFQKKYPEIYLNLETGMSEEDAVTSTDALKNLNTEIMAGNGPDVLILDGIPTDTYTEKGMLADISGILDKTEEADGLLQNIRNAYVEEDGSQYVMPVRFAIPMIQGTAEDVENIVDLETLADAAEKYQSEYSENCLPMTMMTYGSEAFLKALADVNGPAWLKDDGTLDESAVTEYLTQANRIYQAGKEGVDALSRMMEEAGMSVSYLSDTDMDLLKELSGSAMSLLSGAYKLSAGRLTSPDALALVSSVEKTDSRYQDALWNGQAENCFIPVQTVGISAKAGEPEAAEKLVEFLFSQEGQRAGTSAGFPVNETVYDSEEYWAVGDSDGLLGVMSSSNNQTGETVEISIRRADDEKTEEIKALGKSLVTPSETNEIILNAVAEAGGKYLNGEIGLEEAVRAALQEVNLYLAE